MAVAVAALVIMCTDGGGRGVGAAAVIITTSAKGANASQFAKTSSYCQSSPAKKGGQE